MNRDSIMLVGQKKYTAWFTEIVCLGAVETKWVNEVDNVKCYV